MNRINQAAVAAVLALGSISSAFATYTPQSYSGVSEAVTGEIGAAITTGLPIMGLVLGLFVGLRVLKRMAKG